MPVLVRGPRGADGARPRLRRAAGRARAGAAGSACARSPGPTAIPVLETEEGELFRGTRAIFRYLETREPWEHADAHRQRFLDHADARKSDGMARIVARFRHDEPGPTGRRGARRRSRRRRPGGEPLRAPARRPPHRPRRLPAARRPDRVHAHRDRLPRARAAASARGSCRSALDDARARGLEIVPLCPFVAAS